MGARCTTCLARQWYPLRLSLAEVPGSVLPACMTLAENYKLNIITECLYLNDKDPHRCLARYTTRVSDGARLVRCDQSITSLQQVKVKAALQFAHQPNYQRCHSMHLKPKP
jgi:hypothetical protein